MSAVTHAALVALSVVAASTRVAAQDDKVADGKAAPAPNVEAALEATGKTPAPSFAFDRVDLIAEDTGTWINYELPVIGASTTTSAVRFVEQVKVSVSLPVEGLYAGASIQSQSVSYEWLLAPRWGLGLNAGLHTKLLLPRGLFLTGVWRVWRTRVAFGVSVTSATSWARPDWSSWVVLPTVGFGLGREYVGFSL